MTLYNGDRFARKKEIAMRGQKLLTTMIVGMLLLVCLSCGKGREQEARLGARLPKPEPSTASVITKTGNDGAEMVLIPAGEFQMGTNPSQLVQWAKEWSSDTSASWFEREAPRHKVYLDSFYMDRYEVTNALYRKFMDATGHKAPGIGMTASITHLTSLYWA